MRGTRGRNGKIAPRKRKSRLGSVLFFIGLLSVLGTTFVVGALAGRLSVSPGGTAKDDHAAKPTPPAPPTLTFYRELTAPLATPAPPPPPSRAHGDKIAKVETPRPDGRKRGETPPAASPALPEGSATAVPHRADAAGRYTVQVGSYNARAQAEALRARLSAAGHPAYIADGEANGTTRYRVRVGSFASREEAIQAAVRLGTEARVATLVTTR